MREIKFRGYSITDKKWVYGNLIIKDKIPWILEKPIGCYSKNRINRVYDCLGGRFRFELHRVDEESVGQFVGLRDSNNKKVYEGDVVSFTYWSFGNKYVDEQLIGTVRFNQKKSAFVLTNILQDYYNFGDEIELACIVSDKAKFEVIDKVYKGDKMNNSSIDTSSSSSNEKIDAELDKIKKILHIRDKECKDSKGYTFTYGQPNYSIYLNYSYYPKPLWEVAAQTPYVDTPTVWFKTAKDAELVCELLNLGKYKL